MSEWCHQNVHEYRWTVIYYVICYGNRDILCYLLCEPWYIMLFVMWTVIYYVICYVNRDILCYLLCEPWYIMLFVMWTVIHYVICYVNRDTLCYFFMWTVIHYVICYFVQCIKRRYLISCTWRESQITFIRYAQCQMIGEPDNL
jgi:hypothetical protein